MSTAIAPEGHGRGERLLMAVIALAASVGVILQFWLSLSWPGAATGGSAVVRFLSYFTIVSNLMVALTTGHAVLGRSTTGWLGQPTVRAAIVVYIVVTGVVYWLLLAGQVERHGLGVWTNALLHTVTPILYPLTWLVYGTHGRLRWSDAARWLIVPGVYLVWTLARGSWSQEYPYAFVDVGQFGMAAVLRNALGLFLVFLVLGLGLVAIDRRLGRGRAR